ncbi:MAG TPA: PilZ domain-containing protein [Nitrospira sp.]|nr:PilZ domain-containing protein [Nitrospira sp.]
MLQFGRRVDGLSGRRRRVRQPVILAASAMSIDRSRSVLVADLSPSGAKLLGRDLPNEGSEVLVAVGSQDSFATIVWRNDDGCGIEFEQPLPQHRLAQLEHEGSWVSVTGATV